MSKQKLNRISEVLRSQGRSNRWLAAQLGKSEVTVSRWCQNIQQPKIETLFAIGKLLGVSARELLEE